MSGGPAKNPAVAIGSTIGGTQRPLADNPPISLRCATAADMVAVAVLHRLARRVCLPYLPVLHSVAADEAYFRDRVARECRVWLAETDTLCGFIAFRTGWIDHLYVHPQHQRRGTGTALLGQAFAAGPPLRLWAFQRNAPAIRFYTRHGFELVQTTDGRDNEEREPDALYCWAPDQGHPLR